MQLSAGALWDGRYRVERAIGRGASGVVYRARDEASGGDGDAIALKLLSPAATRGDDASLRLEFALLARFRHPNLVSVRRFATANEVPYLVVELVDGPTLDCAIAAGGPGALLGLTLGVLRGLAYLHGNGFVHQDLKPSNILVAAPGGDAAGGTPKIADLGVAALRGVEEGDSVSGTLPFLSPERLRGAPADPRADLWALGITIHACAAGRLPVRASTSEQLARRLETAPIAPLRDLCPAAPIELERFTARLLALDPRERFRDAGEALADLERTVRHRGASQEAPAEFAGEPALVGRDPVIARARAVLAPRPQPTARLVLVRAADGLGRTRVADELAIHAQLAGAVAVRVPARPGLAPWVGALTELVSVQARAEEGAGGAGGASATQLITAPAIAERIADILARSPGVLVVDDLDRRDRLARDMVDRIAVSLAARPIRHVAGVIAASGPGLLPADRGAAVVLELGPLSEDALRDLIGSALGSDPPPAVAALLIEEVGGSPALAVASLRALIATGALRRIGGMWDLVGDGREVVRRGVATDRRLVGLSAPARDALDALAVFGPAAEVELATLGRAADLDDNALAAAIEEGCAAQLIALAPGRDGRGASVRHRSEAIRASCASALAPAPRTAIHRRAWDALRARGITDPELLCGHAIGAGLVESARALAIAAADAAHARGDHLTALAAVDLAATDPGAPSAPPLHPPRDPVAAAASARGVIHRRARALLELGRVAEARTALAALPADPDDADAALLDARAVVAAGDAGATPPAIAALERLAAAGRLAPAQRGELAVLRVEAARLRAPEEAIVTGEAELARFAGDDVRRARIHTIVAQAAMATVDLPRARHELETALAIAERLDDAPAIVEVRGWLAAVADMSNRGDEALEHVAAGLEHAANAPAGVPFARLLNLRGILAMWTGRLDEAAESLLEAERRARLAGGQKLASSAAGNLVVVHRRQGLYGQALAAALRSLRLKRALGDRAGRVTTFINLTDLYAEFGDVALAESAARRGIAGGRALGHRRIWAQGLLSLAGVLVDRGELAGTREALAECGGSVDQHNQVELWFIEGKLARASGDVPGALAALGRAIDRSRAIGNAHDEGRALLERASLVGELGADDLRRAADAAGRSGSREVAWNAHARLGLLLRPTDPAAADRELARAREVAATVIADLSPRHQARYRASPRRAALLALLEAGRDAPTAPLIVDGARAGDDVGTVMIRPVRPVRS